MPGVRPLLDELVEPGRVYLALLTGNFEAGARVKLEYFDLWRYFRCGAFGDDAPDRNDLLATRWRASRRAEARRRPSDVVVVGDTPLDVAVALCRRRAIGWRRDGQLRRRALRAQGARRRAEDLSDLPAVLEALGSRARRIGAVGESVAPEIGAAAGGCGSSGPAIRDPDRRSEGLSPRSDERRRREDPCPNLRA